MVKKYSRFIRESSEQQATQPPAQTQQPTSTQPASTQPAAQTTQPSTQPVQAQSGSTQGTQSAQSTENKFGDLSNYNKPEVTNFPETVKKIADLIKELNKDELLELRGLIAKFKGIEDPKTEIGKL